MAKDFQQLGEMRNEGKLKKKIVNWNVDMETMERISWTEKKTNEKVLRRVKEKRSMDETIIRRKTNWIAIVLDWKLVNNGSCHD